MEVEGAPKKIIFASNGAYVACVHNSEEVSILDTETLNTLKLQPGHQANCLNIVFR